MQYSIGSWWTSSTTALTMLVWVCLSALPARAADKPERSAPVREKLLALWADLADDDEATAWRAALALAAEPKDAITLFRGRLSVVAAA